MAIHKRSPQNNWIRTLKRVPDTYCRVMKLTQSETKEKALARHSQMFQATPGCTFRAALNETFIKTSSHSTMLPRVSPYQNSPKPPFDRSKLPLPKIGSSVTSSYCPPLPPLLSRNPQNDPKDRSMALKENVLSPTSVPILSTTKPVEQAKDNTASALASAVTMASSKTFTTISVAQGQSRTISALTAEKSQHEFDKDGKGQTLITDSSLSLSVVSFSATSSPKLTSITTTTDPPNQRSNPGVLRDQHTSPTDDSVGDQKDIEKRNRRKFYWYGSHKLIKPIKDIPPRFQLMLAETNAEKARCEGRPIILRQHGDQIDHFSTAPPTAFNPDGQCFIPNFSYNPSRLCSSDCLMERKDIQTLAINPSTNSALNTSSGAGNNNDPMGDITQSLSQQVPPMYTLHIYSSACNPNTPGSATGTNAAGNACCFHLPVTSGSPTGGYMSNLQQNPPHHPASITSPHLQQTPIYFPAQGTPLQPTQLQPAASPSTSYTTGQQTYSAVFPPGMAPTQTFLANPASVGNMGPLTTTPVQTFPLQQYQPCVTYTQNAQYTVTAVPQ